MSRFVAGLASKPLLVVAITFGIGAVATALVFLIAPGMDVAGVVTTLATLWGMDLALVIYLLTAKDTDKLLSHIDALQDQLSAALEAPGPDAVVDTQLEAPKEQPAIAQPPQESLPAPAAPEEQQPAPTPVPRERARTPARTPRQPSHTPPAPQHIEPVPVPTLAESVPVPASPLPELAPASQTGLPAAYLAALCSRTGIDIADIRRAWTPSPFGDGPWVVEDISGNRWSIFQGRRSQPTVIPLGSVEDLRLRREEQIQKRAQHTQVQAERRLQHVQDRMDHLRSTRR